MPHSSEIASVRRAIADFPKLRRDLFEIHSSVQTQAQKESLLERGLHGTGVVFRSAPATYSSSESGEAKRTASSRIRRADQHGVRIHTESQIRLARPIFQDCAATLVPRRAKFEISYWHTPAAFSRSQATS